tara:strand:- start:23 stop:262 length:240 start_codon:yes stop_codon:yes gene_type:complete
MSKRTFYGIDLKRASSLATDIAWLVSRTSCARMISIPWEREARAEAIDPPKRSEGVGALHNWLIHDFREEPRSNPHASS